MSARIPDRRRSVRERRVATSAASEQVADLRDGAADLREGVADQREGAADLRDGVADLREGVADQREGVADKREGIADQREGIADQREGIADQREGIADQREGIADQREGVADQREQTADLREETADLRQEAADLREEVANLRDETARGKAVLSALNETQIREANERLVVAAIHAQTMTEAAERAAAQMAYVAKHDVLTGLPNRALLTDRLSQAIGLAQRHAKKLALMYLDLDHFKHINDSLGHAVGDDLLRSVAKRLQACVRHSDTVCRQGGDEFVVLLSEVEATQDAAASAEKMLKAMAAPHLIGGHRLYVTLSIGISIYPDDGHDVDAIVRNADTAMYYAKECGRNDYRRFTPDMNVRAVARQTVEAALRLALEQREFVLHYQPKVDLASGAITGAEALVRLRPADGGLIGPTEFISIAEDSGLILPLGKWVLREACRQTASWLQVGLDIRQIAVNISPVEFHHKDFLAGVRAILRDTGLDPRYLELELTEGGLMQDTEPTMAILHALNDLGVQIAVDDFGTGYSSLSYLRRFPIDTLKIDQSFVQDMNGNADEAIISAIIAMGKSLNLRVVAEGIETQQQQVFLQARQCAEGQGYFFSQPLSAADFAALLATGHDFRITH